MVAAQAVFRQQGPDLAGRPAGPQLEHLDDRGQAAEGEAGLVDLAEQHPRPQRLPPGRQRHPAEEGSEQRRLAGAVGPDDRDALGPGDLQVDRSEGETVPRDDGFRQRRHHGAGARRRRDRHLQLPLLARLVDLVEAPELALDGLDPRRRVGRRFQPGALGGAVVVGRLAFGPHRAAHRLLPLALRLRHKTGPLVVVLLEGVAGLPPGQLPRFEIGGVAAVEQPRGARRLVDVEHGRDGPGEKLAVVRDDDQARLQRTAELLELLEAGKVEVVGRLVEQEDVVARQQHRGERGPGRLAARQRRGFSSEVDRQAEVVAHLPDAYVEIGATQAEPALQGRAVVIVGAGGALGEGLGRPVERGLCRGHAGPALEERRERLAGPAIRFLREQADIRGRGGQRHGATVGHEQPGEGRQQGGLAGPVRADDPEPGLGADRQRHLRQHQDGAADDSDAGGDEGGGHGPERYPRRSAVR